MLNVIEYTDPYCTWCWGSEPILRKIQEVYEDQVRISYVMGGLVTDITQFYDPANRIGGANWYRQVADHWLDASHRHGMPVDEQVFFDLKDEFRSTHPACIAYKSAQFQDEETANRFLRRMREGAAAERKLIHRIDIQRQLAKETGLDTIRFTEDISSGRAKDAFVQDLRECRSRGITGFPTFLIRNPEGRELILHGYHRFTDFVSVFQELNENTLKTKVVTSSDQSILDFIRKYGRVTEKEIAEVFNLSTELLINRLNKLTNKEILAVEKLGNGNFYSLRI